MTLSRRQVLTLGAAALAAAVAGPARAEDDWSGDVEVLRQAWTTIHPGLYRYITPEALEARLQALATDWRAPGDFRGRFLALTRVTAAVKCGHTYPSPYNGGEPVRSRLYPDRTLVPFAFRWLERQMVVTRDHSAEAAFPPGTVITAIDGVPTGALLEQLIPLARADGGNDAKRVSLMEMRGDDRFETFDIHLPLILPLRDRAVFDRAGMAPVAAGLLTLAERQAPLAAVAQAAPDANPWTLDKGEDGIHRLTMPGWALYNSAFRWEAWLGRVMDDLSAEGARGLIVDLRGNEGGLDCGNVILSRLIERDLPVSRTQRYTRYRRVPDALRPHLNTWDSSFYDWGLAASGPDQDGIYRLTRLGDLIEGQVIRRRGRRYTGPVVVLCDSSNSSATFQFAAAVKDNGLATLVGEPTGGNRRGINGGAFFFLKLPASQIVVDLPIIAGFPATPQPDSGIDPDVPVATTAEDVRLGRDPQMQAATRLVLA
jgi:hypothetical protein